MAAGGATAKDVRALAATPKARLIHLYEVPPELAEGSGVTSIGLVELTAAEELMAAKRVKGESLNLAYELVKQSLAEVSGKPVTLADGSADEAWASFGAKLRHVLLQAWGDLHKAPAEAEELFFKSRRVKV